MNSLLLKYIISKGVQLKQSNVFVDNKLINKLHKNLEPVINSIMYSKGQFLSEDLEVIKKIQYTTYKFLHPKMIIALHLFKDSMLDRPKLNVDYYIMYYINEQQQIILLNYELSD